MTRLIAAGGLSWLGHQQEAAAIADDALVGHFFRELEGPLAPVINNATSGAVNRAQQPFLARFDDCKKSDKKK